MSSKFNSNKSKRVLKVQYVKERRKLFKAVKNVEFGKWETIYWRRVNV